VKLVKWDIFNNSQPYELVGIAYSAYVYNLRRDVQKIVNLCDVIAARAISKIRLSKLGISQI
jgi:hypothetical protein